MKRKIINIISFIRRDLWSHSEKAPLSGFVIRQIKLFIISWQNSALHKIKVSSGALTFYTLTSLVPLLALLLAISKGFGIEERILGYLHNDSESYQSVVEHLTGFANSYLENSKAGVVAGIGFVVLGWSVIMVFSHIESAFNTTWGIKRQRSIARKFTDYMAVVISTPILLFIYSSLNSVIENQMVEALSSIPFIEHLAQGALYVLNALVLFMIFTLAYYLFPNTRVKFSAAFYASIVAATVYMIFISAYIYLQDSITSYNTVYGGFAALPLFLIWLNTSWHIVLFGAELSYAYQNLSRFEHMKMTPEISYSYKRKLSLVAAATIVHDFMEQREAPTPSEIAERVGVTVNSLEDVIFDLEAANIIKGVDKDGDKEYRYMPAYDQSQLTIIKLCRTLDEYTTSGKSDKSNFNSNIDKIFTDIDQRLYGSDADIKLIDIKLNSDKADR